MPDETDQLTCDVCGPTDPVYEAGVAWCPVCGVAYPLERERIRHVAPGGEADV